MFIDAYISMVYGKKIKCLCVKGNCASHTFRVFIFLRISQRIWELSVTQCDVVGYPQNSEKNETILIKGSSCECEGKDWGLGINGQFLHLRNDNSGAWKGLVERTVLFSVFINDLKMS